MSVVARSVGRTHFYDFRRREIVHNVTFSDRNNDAAGDMIDEMDGKRLAFHNEENGLKRESSFGCKWRGHVLTKQNAA